jgi:hypothetical protein
LKPKFITRIFCNALISNALSRAILAGTAVALLFGKEVRMMIQTINIKMEEIMNRLRSINFGRRTILAAAAVPVLIFGVSAQPSFAASRGVNAYTTDSVPGGRVVATISWQRVKGNGPYAGRVYGTVFDREGDDDYCALAQVSLDGNVNNVGRACPSDREQGFDFPFNRTRQALARVCLVKGTKLAYCSEWK